MAVGPKKLICLRSWGDVPGYDDHRPSAKHDGQDLPKCNLDQS